MMARKNHEQNLRLEGQEILWVDYIKDYGQEVKVRMAQIFFLEIDIG
jgi:hypothetical protein